MDADPLAVLRNTFGYDAFRPPQDEVIATLMRGSDALVLMPTGDGALRLTEDCRPVLRGEEALWLRRETRPERKRRDKRPAAGRVTFEDIADERLWEALRARRREIADEQSVPPYVVFHDATLAEMVAHRPSSPEELAEISGVGARKLEAYGEDFLAVIREDGKG